MLKTHPYKLKSNKNTHWLQTWETCVSSKWFLVTLHIEVRYIRRRFGGCRNCPVQNPRISLGLWRHLMCPYQSHGFHFLTQRLPEGWILTAAQKPCLEDHLYLAGINIHCRHTPCLTCPQVYSKPIWLNEWIQTSKVYSSNERNPRLQEFTWSHF